LRFWRQHYYYLVISTVLVAGLCAAGTVLQTGSPRVSTPTQEHSFGRRLTIEGVPNAGQVTANLYRGGQPTATGFDALASMGLTSSWTCGAHAKARANEWRSLGCGILRFRGTVLSPKMKRSRGSSFCFGKTPAKKVFVHCRLGDDRTGMMVAAYRMAEQNWTATEARKEMEAFGFSMPHHFICPSLSGYEGTFPQRFNSDPVFDGLRAPAASPAR
jgi:tyrosine-protein phosphatase SIW14